MTSGASLLEVRELTLRGAELDRPILDRVSMEVAPGETLGVVGESGSGKSMTMASVLGLLPSTQLHISGGQVLFKGKDLVQAAPSTLRAIRGRQISMIFQDPMSALNPALTVGRQVAEPLLIHRVCAPAEARSRAVAMLGSLGIDDPERRMRQYPHEFSGGMLQRVAIGMALITRPDLVIADEPTTALDATTRLQILDLLAHARAEHHTALIFITHDLGVVSRIADRLVVMRAGEVVETGPASRVLSVPEHAYTRTLLTVAPRLTAPPPATSTAVATRASARDAAAPESAAESAQPIVRVRDLTVRYRIKKPGAWRSQPLEAVRAVSFDVAQGETLGIVGESGSGKSSTGRALLGLERIAGGTVTIDGFDVGGLRLTSEKPFRRTVQMVFQDPVSSLNPRLTIGESISRPLRQLGSTSGVRVRDAVADKLETVGLPADFAKRFPFELSGGQRQRVGIARALIVEPSVLVCDEPVSALDVSIQAQVVELLRDLRDRLDLTMVFISHDMAVVRSLAHRVAVMRAGRIVELGDNEQVFEAPADPYTRTLIDSVLEPPELHREPAGGR